MSRLRLLLVAAVWTAAASAAGPVRAAEPSSFTYAPLPPGTIVQSRLVYLAGEGMQSQWRAVISKKQVGAGAGQKFYQWYLSIYAIDGSTYKLKYKSPGDGGPFDTVTKANGANMWYPFQSAKIAGVAELMAPGIQQVVVQAHQQAADCGSATVTVFAYDGKANKVVPSAFVENGCQLDASIVERAAGNAIALKGPYFGPNAAMCCPTKPAASAVLRYVAGTWKEEPAYYTLKALTTPP